MWFTAMKHVFMPIVYGTYGKMVNGNKHKVCVPNKPANHCVYSVRLMCTMCVFLPVLSLKSGSRSRRSRRIRGRSLSHRASVAQSGIYQL